MKKKLFFLVSFLTFECFMFAANPKILDLSKKDYQKAIEKTLLSTGNNARLKLVLEKLQNGEDVFVAALGGSVTEGAGPADYRDGYAYQFFNKLKSDFTKNDGKNIHFDGAGLSGTPSPLGLVRYQSDVVDFLGHIPDLLIIEFAVNDGSDPFCQRGFEALVRNALSSSEETAVIALFSDAKTYRNTQGTMIPIARHYEIPMISIQDAVERSGVKIDEDKFFADYVHPTKDGHTFMADALINLLEVVKKSPTDEKNQIPSECLKQPSFEGFKRIFGDDENVKISAGSFNKIDSQGQSLKKTNKSDFPQNWYRKSRGSSDESFVIEINCRSLIFVYKEQGSWMSEKFGKADIFVDGKKIETFDGGKSGGWNNAVTKLIIDEEKSANHKVEVKMAEGDENKGFTILALGYTK